MRTAHWKDALLHRGSGHGLPTRPEVLAEDRLVAVLAECAAIERDSDNPEVLVAIRRIRQAAGEGM